MKLKLYLIIYPETVINNQYRNTLIVIIKNVTICFYPKRDVTFFYVLLTVHLSVILDNDQIDTHLVYFTIRLL